MKALLTTLLLTLAIGAQATETDDEAFYHHAAQCVALLKQDALALVPAAKGGDVPAKAQMVQLTAWGFGFIASAYKRGLRNPRADTLLDEAEADQQTWPASRRQSQTDRCLTDARDIFTNASGLERAIVNNRAAARVERLLNRK